MLARTAFADACAVEFGNIDRKFIESLFAADDESGIVSFGLGLLPIIPGRSRRPDLAIMAHRRCWIVGEKPNSWYIMSQSSDTRLWYISFAVFIK